MSIFKYVFLLLAISIGQIPCREIPEEDQDQIKLRLENPREHLKPDQIHANEESLSDNHDADEDKPVIHGNEEGLLDKQGNNKNEHVINLNLNIELKNSEKEHKDSFLSEKDFDNFNWKTVTTIFNQGLKSEADKEFREFNSGESLFETLEETEESPKRLRRSPPRISNIMFKLEIIYNMIHDLVMKDKILNNKPLVFLNTLYPTVKEHLIETRKLSIEKAITYLDNILNIPFIRIFLFGFIRDSDIDEDFNLSDIENQLYEYMEFSLEISEFEDNEDNKILTKLYKLAFKTFLEIIREDVKNNNLPAGTFEFIWMKNKEFYEYSYIKPRVLSKREADLNFKSKEKKRSDISSNIKNILKDLDKRLNQMKKGNNLKDKPSYTDATSSTVNKYLKKLVKSGLSEN